MRWLVWSPAIMDAQAAPFYRESRTSPREQVEMLRVELEEAHAANRENRRIIAALTSRIPAIEAPSEAPGAAESATVAPERAEQPRSATEGAQEPSERPWWRRMFGS